MTYSDNEYYRGYYAQNREKLLEQHEVNRLKRKHQDPIGYMINSTRKRAKERGLEFRLTRKDIFLPPRCPVFGIPLFYTDGDITDNTPSLDRLDNDYGYIPGNVYVISYRANQLKSDMSYEEIENLYLYVRERRNLTVKPKETELELEMEFGEGLLLKGI